jgi:hypothetical protein
MSSSFYMYCLSGRREFLFALSAGWNLAVTKVIAFQAKTFSFGLFFVGQVETY